MVVVFCRVVSPYQEDMGKCECEKSVEGASIVKEHLRVSKGALLLEWTKEVFLHGTDCEDFRCVQSDTDDPESDFTSLDNAETLGGSFSHWREFCWIGIGGEFVGYRQDMGRSEDLQRSHLCKEAQLEKEESKRHESC